MWSQSSMTHREVFQQLWNATIRVMSRILRIVTQHQTRQMLQDPRHSVMHPTTYSIHVGHCWPIVPAPDDRWWLWSSWWNEDWQGKPKYSEKTCPSATLSTTNPTWPDLRSNPGRRSGKPATNRLSYGTAFSIVTRLRELYGRSLILGRSRDFALRHCFLTGSGAHTDPYSIGSWGSFHAGKEAGAYS
jgi:hypothetical protein